MGEKRLTITSLCLIAVVAITALVATSAMAAAPEYGRCKKAAEVNKKYTGKLDNSKCTPPVSETEKKAVEKGEGKYEWYPGFEKAKFTSSGGVGVLTTVGGAGVECKTESSAGEFGPGANNKEESGVFVKFNGCKSVGQPCSTPGAEREELITNELDGVVGWENKALKKTDLELYPAPGDVGGLFIEFSCVGLVVKVRGHVLVPIKNDKMTFSETLKFVASKGKQKPEKWEESSEKAILEASFKGGPFEQSGQQITSTIKSEEQL